MATITMSGSIMVTPDKVLIKSPEFPEMIFDIRPKAATKTLEIRMSVVRDGKLFLLDSIDVPPAVIMHAEAMRIERGW